MPVSLLNADTMFPSFTEGTSSSEKIDVVMNYLYMLLEELRYTFGNLGTENFNDKSLDELSVQLTKPVYGMIEDATAGLTHEFEITAQGLQSQIRSVDGRVTSLSITVGGFDTRISNAEGQVSTLTQTVNTFDVRITNASSNASDAKNIAASLSAKVDDNSASISQIVSAVGSSGKVTAASIVAAVNNSGSSVKISADKVDISGFVTFKELEDSDSITTINGAAITTGTISASTFNMLLDRYGDWSGEMKFYYNMLSSSWLVGGIRIDDQGAGTDDEGTFRVIIYTHPPSASSAVDFSLKLLSEGKMSLEAGSYMFISSGGNLTIRANNGRGILNLDGDVYIRGTSLDEILASL